MLISPDEPFPILTFCALHPCVAFMLAWPIALCIIAASWLGAQVLNNTVTMLTNSFVQLLNAFIIVFRGYPAPERGNTDLHDEGTDK